MISLAQSVTRYRETLMQKAQRLMPQLLGDGVYTVPGDTGEYRVSLTSRNHAMRWVCNCRYVGKENCSHILAVIYAENSRKGTMPNNLAKVAPESAELASRVNMDVEQLEFISKKYCNGAPPIEVEHFIRFAQAQGLDISAKQAYLIGRNDKNVSPQDGGKSWTIQIAIDGYRAIAEATGEYDGQDPPVFEHDKNGKLISATVTVYRKGMNRGVAATAFFDEYNGNNSMWARMPRGQLAKCAEALALRKAFPKRLGGTYTGDEMHQADRPDNVRPMQNEQQAFEAAKPVNALPSGEEAERAVLIRNIYTMLGVVTKGKKKDDPIHGETIERVAAMLQLDHATSWADITTVDLRGFVANISTGDDEVEGEAVDEAA